MQRVDEANPPAAVATRSWGTLLDEQATWLESQRATLMVVATFVAGMAYGGVLSPPGGVSSEPLSRRNRVYPEGTSVLAVNNPLAFRKYYITNEIAFLASFSLVLLLLTGLPFNGRVRVCILTAILTIVMIAMVLSYGYAIAAYTPVNYEGPEPVLAVVGYSAVGWCVLVAVIVIAHITHLVVNMRRRRRRRRRT